MTVPRPLRPAALLLLGALLAACGSDVRSQPPVAGAVITYQAPGASLAGRSTFSPASRVGLVTLGEGGQVFAEAPAVRAALVAGLQARGLALAAEVDPASPPATPPAADLLVHVTALQATDTAPAYWLAFAGHATPAVLGLPGFDWEYGWTWENVPVLPGSLLVQIGDAAGRTAGSGGAPGRVPVIWAAVAFGVAPGGDWDAPAAVEAVGRALAQSPWLGVAP